VVEWHAEFTEGFLRPKLVIPLRNFRDRPHHARTRVSYHAIELQQQLPKLFWQVTPMFAHERQAGFQAGSANSASGATEATIVLQEGGLNRGMTE
jgi:hypothetical protein